MVDVLERLFRRKEGIRNQKELIKKLQKYKTESVLGFTAYEGTVPILDQRAATYHQILVRILLGSQYPDPHSQFHTPLEHLWGNAIHQVFDGQIGIPRYTEKPPSLATLVDSSRLHPKQPITLIDVHAVEGYGEELYIQPQNPLTDEPHEVLPFSAIRQKIENLDQQLWTRQRNHDPKPPSLIVLAGCNNEGFSLPDRNTSIVYYRSGLVGGVFGRLNENSGKLCVTK